MSEKMPHNAQTRREVLQNLGIGAVAALGIAKLSGLWGNIQETDLKRPEGFSPISLDADPAKFEQTINHFLAQSLQRINKHYDSMNIQLDGAKIAYNTQESVGNSDSDILPYQKQIYKLYFNRIYAEYHFTSQEVEKLGARFPAHSNMIKKMHATYTHAVKGVVNIIKKGVDAIARIEHQRAEDKLTEKAKAEQEKTNI